MQAAWPRASEMCVLPRPTLLMKTTLVLACDEGQTEQVLDLWAVDLFWPAPLEVFHGLEHGEAGFSDAPLDGAVLAHGGLALDQLRQILQMRELLVGGFAGEFLVVAFDVVRGAERSSCASNRARSLGVMVSSIVDIEVGGRDVDVEQIVAAGEL